MNKQTKKQNPFRNDSFADLWAKTEYVQQFVAAGMETGPIDPETQNKVTLIVGDLYAAMQKRFGDKRIDKVIEFAYKLPEISRIIH